MQMCDIMRTWEILFELAESKGEFVLGGKQLFKGPNSIMCIIMLSAAIVLNYYIICITCEPCAV
jgi:hypothetical protein